MVLAEWVASTSSETIDIQGATPDQYQLILQEKQVVDIAENLVYDPNGLMSGYIVAEKMIATLSFS